MSTNVTACNQGTDGSTDPRPNYIRLGRDSTGADHCYATTTETVHIIGPNGGRERKILWDTDKTVDDYVETVADARGWEDQRYGRDLFAEFLAPYAEADE